jgi:hypothetical protein
MARRKSSKPRRRTTNKISLTGLAETAIIGSAMTKMFFNVNLASFFTGVTTGSKAGTGFYPSSDGGSRITLPELAGINSRGEFSADRVGGTYASGQTFTSTVLSNMKANAFQAVAVAVVTPIIFRMGKKTFRKPLSTIRKGLKGTGVTV